MKKFVLFVVATGFVSAMQAQLKTTPVCPEFSVDLLNGKVNNLPINATGGQVKELFPCFSSAEEATGKCGATVFYKEKDIFFYPGRSYVEIGSAFKGKLTIPMMGAARNGVFKWLGNPKIKDVNWDAYQTAYGILILYFNKAGKVSKIQLSTKATDTIKLCE